MNRLTRELSPKAEKELEELRRIIGSYEDTRPKHYVVFLTGDQLRLLKNIVNQIIKEAKNETS